jgi:hypothetical protein
VVEQQAEDLAGGGDAGGLGGEGVPADLDEGPYRLGGSDREDGTGLRDELRLAFQEAAPEGRKGGPGADGALRELEGLRRAGGGVARQQRLEDLELGSGEREISVHGMVLELFDTEGHGLNRKAQIGTSREQVWVYGCAGESESRFPGSKVRELQRPAGASACLMIYIIECLICQGVDLPADGRGSGHYVLHDERARITDAAAGELVEGHAELVAGLRRTEVLQEEGTPWAAELVERFRTEVLNYYESNGTGPGVVTTPRTTPDDRDWGPGIRGAR